MKRFLVTGCAGFIASNTALQLMREGHQVVGIDNLNDAYDTRLKLWRLKQLHQQPHFRFGELDISDRHSLRRLFSAPDREVPFDGVINLAARAGVRASVENPWIYNETNTVGTLNLLDQCRETGVGKFVLASTSSVYGDEHEVPFCESADTSRFLSPYACSKKAAETLCYTYHRLHGIDVTVLRYFTVYGPAGRPDMSVFRFVRRIAEGESIVVFGDGSQSRDFTYVEDIARGTVAALKPLGYEIINLGGDRPSKLMDIIEGIAGRLGKSAQIDYQPAHPADVPATWAKIDKARTLLGWEPETKVETGLDRCVQWYLDNRDFAKTIELGDRAPTKATQPVA